MYTLSIVIPVYNEFNTFEGLLDKVRSVDLGPDFKKELVVVDDYSTDGTRDLLAKLKQEDIQVFYHEKNKGKGAALRTGFQKCTGDFVIVQDADLEYDPNEYTKLLKPVLDNKADVVYGSRFMGGEPHRILYFWHMLGNRLLTLLSNIFSDLNLTDMETCYKLFRREIIQSIEIEEDRFGFEPEVTAKLSDMARKGKISIYEVGISYYGRTYDEGKKIGLKDAFRALYCILKYNTTSTLHFIKYGMGGLVVAASQIGTILFLVEGLQLGKDLHSIAHAISVEISILVGFFIHSRLSWRFRFTGFGQFLKKFFLFHAVTAVSFVIRQVLFHQLQNMGMDYMTSTLVGIAVAVVMNFFGYDKLVFKALPAEKESNTDK